MKDHEIREFVNRLTTTALKHAGCDSLKAAISREVKDTLTSDSVRRLEEEHKEREAEQKAHSYLLNC